MAEAIITIGETGYSEHVGRFVSVKAECTECDYRTWTGGNPDRDWSGIIDDHLAQHRPGRALDIEVDWEPSARCSVCKDGIGDILQEDDGLTCRECGTYWSIDGTGGYREAS